MADKTVNIRLPKKLEKGNLGYVDPGNGVMISKRRYVNGAQIVPETNFVRGKISSGQLIKVDEPSKSSGQESDTPGDYLVAVTLGTNMKYNGERHKAGDTLQVPAGVAEQWVSEGKAVLAA